MDLDAVARELYALPPEEFVAARNERSKKTREEGQRDLAKQVSLLRKPTVAAWLVNQLTRQHPQDVAVLLDLGREMREGMTVLGAEDLRALTRRRYQLISALVQEARALGPPAGRVVSDDVAMAVRATLEATLSDPTSAEMVESGSLVSALHVSGFGSQGGDPHTLTPMAVGADAEVADLASHRERRADAVKQAEAEVGTAENAVRRARARSEEAELKVGAAQQQCEEAAAVVEEVSEQLARATADLERRTDLAHEAASARDAAELARQRAERQLQEAGERLRRLTPNH